MLGKGGPVNFLNKLATDLGIFKKNAVMEIIRWKLKMVYGIREKQKKKSNAVYDDVMISVVIFISAHKSKVLHYLPQFQDSAIEKKLQKKRRLAVDFLRTTHIATVHAKARLPTATGAVVFLSLIHI